MTHGKHIVLNNEYIQTQKATEIRFEFCIHRVFFVCLEMLSTVSMCGFVDAFNQCNMQSHFLVNILELYLRLLHDKIVYLSAAYFICGSSIWRRPLIIFFSMVQTVFALSHFFIHFSFFFFHFWCMQLFRMPLVAHLRFHRWTLFMCAISQELLSYASESK